MHEITLNLRYRKNSKLLRISVQTDKDKLSIEELSWLLAEEMARKFSEYQGGMKDQKKRQDLRRYKLGQYKFIRNYLEATI